MVKQFFTRDAALEYLASDVSFRGMYNGNLNDLGRTTALRYANKLYDIESSGDTLRSIGELRGHLVSEHHAGRGRKPGTQGYDDPRNFKDKRGWFFYGLEGQRLGSDPVIVRITSGERAAVRALQHDVRDERDRWERANLAHWLRQKPPGREWQVTINLTGAKRGQFQQLMQHGWSNKGILKVAGYVEDAHGNWKLGRGGKGLKKYLLELVNNLPRRSGDPSPWRGIKLYEIYLWRGPVNEKIDPSARSRPVDQITR